MNVYFSKQFHIIYFSATYSFFTYEIWKKLNEWILNMSNSISGDKWLQLKNVLLDSYNICGICQHIHPPHLCFHPIILVASEFRWQKFFSVGPEVTFAPFYLTSSLMTNLFPRKASLSGPNSYKSNGAKYKLYAR